MDRKVFKRRRMHEWETIWAAHRSQTQSAPVRPCDRRLKIQMQRARLTANVNDSTITADSHQNSPECFLLSTLSHFKSVMRLKADRQGKLHPSLQSGETSSIGQIGHDIGRLMSDCASMRLRHFSGSATLPLQLISSFWKYSFFYILLHWLGCRLYSILFLT